MVKGSKQNAARTRLRFVGLLAAHILALTTGLPLHSTENFLPHPGEQAGPYL